MPRLRFHNLNNGTNNRIGSEDITSIALLIFCAVVVLIPVTGIATFTWYMPFAFFSGVAVMFCGTVVQSSRVVVAGTAVAAWTVISPLLYLWMSNLTV